MNIIEEIQKRRSVRKFKKDAVSQDQINLLLKAGMFAPTARHSNAIEYIVISSQNIKDELFPLLNQDFILNAPLLIAPIADIDKNGIPVQDLAIASSHIMLQAVKLNLGSVWKHIHPGNETTLIKQILKIPEHFDIINILAIGHPDESLPEHLDSEFLKEKIHSDTF